MRSIGKGSISNAAYVKNNYNTVDTKGGRAALKLDAGDWTVTPTVMGQRVTTEGFFGYDPAVGDLQVAHFGPEYSDDSFMQIGLTVEGKVSNFDIVYAGAYMKRTTHSIADYSDYSYFYDQVDGSGVSWTGNNGQIHHAAGIGGVEGLLSKSGVTKSASRRRKICPCRRLPAPSSQRQLHRHL